jgi:hypothetical protein
MSNRFCPTARTTAPASEKPASDDTTVGVADFNRLSGDEIERLIALCEAPGLLWRHEPAPARAPEPFGMIA